MISIRPEPQIPAGLPPPITLHSSFPSTRCACSIAPSAPRIPQAILAPSKAGPAAVEHAIRRFSFPRTISPFVPMSIISVIFFSSSRFTARRHATVSAPTKPAITGKATNCPPGWIPRWNFSAGNISPWLMAGLYGAWTRESGTIPRKRWCMQVFPTTLTW